MIFVLAWWMWSRPALCPDRPSPTTYTVQPGDTLRRIAREHQADLYRLVEVNGRVDQKLVAGDALRLP